METSSDNIDRGGTDPETLHDVDVINGRRLPGKTSNMHESVLKETDDENYCRWSTVFKVGKVWKPVLNSSEMRVTYCSLASYVVACCKMDIYGQQWCVCVCVYVFDNVCVYGYVYARSRVPIHNTFLFLHGFKHHATECISLSGEERMYLENLLLALNDQSF